MNECAEFACRNSQLLVLLGGAVMIHAHRHSFDDKGATNVRELRSIASYSESGDLQFHGGFCYSVKR